MAGEDEAGRTPPTAEQAPQAQTQAQTATATHEPVTGQPEPVAEQASPSPGFGERGRMRRRARFLRKARELAYRDLGGLVYDLHRFGQRNDPVVLAKLATLGHIDAELRALEQALHEIRPVTVLREVGIAACPRCASIHGNEDRFCPGCGLAFSADAERPLSTAPVTSTPPGDTSAASSPASGALTSPSPATPAPPSSAPGRPAGEPLTTVERPPTAAPVLKPTASPVAARPPATDDGKRKADSGNGDGKHDPEDEPTQILRPPAGGA
ncbi:MAG TPA: hypothetical protein VGY30_08875 [Solirubrobacteraceae bacterium]|nr:hypothetical protein [Solirubrobacteraceae bacterium]